MKKHRYIPLPFLGLALLSACQTVVDIDLPEEPGKLVVNSYFSPDTVWEVSVSASKPILSNDPLPFIDNATVVVHAPDGTKLELQRVPEKPGTYSFPSAAMANEQYLITVSASGYKDISATGSAPGAVQIQNVDTGSTFANGFRQKEVKITFKDPGNERNYYAVKLYYEVVVPGGPSFTAPLFYTFTNSDFFGGSSTDLLDDTPFNGKKYTLTLAVNTDDLGSFPEDSIAPSFPINLITELRSVSEEYYLYESSLARYFYASNDPFAQPAQVFTNVENGFGIFAGYSASRDTLQVSD